MKLKVIGLIVILASFYGFTFCFAESNITETEKEAYLCDSVDDCNNHIYDLLTEIDRYLKREIREASPDNDSIFDAKKQIRIYDEKLLLYYKRLEVLALDAIDARNFKHAREEIAKLKEKLAGN